MYKKTIEYIDYNGVERKEDFYFNFTKAELMEMEYGTSGGLTNMMTSIISAQDTPSLIKIFKDLILKAYGVKSPDGKRFIKNDEVRDSFAQTEAYSMMFMELATDDEAAIKFVNGVVPKDVAEQASSQIASLEANTQA